VRKAKQSRGIYRNLKNGICLLSWGKQGGEEEMEEKRGMRNSMTK